MDGRSPPDLRVLIIAGDPLARAGLHGLLAEAVGFGPVDAGMEMGDLTGALDAYHADVVLWDLGTDANPAPTSDLQGAGPPVVALLPDDTLAEQAWAAGAHGLLLRSADTEMITGALAAVEGGLIVIDPDLTETVLALHEPALAPPEDLTPREEEVLQLLAEGLPNKLIADRLTISENTVKFHVSSIFSKLGVHSRTEAVTRAARQGLLII